MSVRTVISLGIGTKNCGTGVGYCTGNVFSHVHQKCPKVVPKSEMGTSLTWHGVRRMFFQLVLFGICVNGQNAASCDLTPQQPLHRTLHGAGIRHARISPRTGAVRRHAVAKLGTSTGVAPLREDAVRIQT